MHSDVNNASVIYDYTENPTTRPPATRPCGHLFCGFFAVANSDRCEHHGGKPTVRMHAVTLEAFQEACRDAA